MTNKNIANIGIHNDLHKEGWATKKSNQTGIINHAIQTSITEVPSTSIKKSAKYFELI